MTTQGINIMKVLKGCQIIRHAYLQVPQPTKQTIPQSIVLIWTPSDQMRASGSSARRKVALPPGRSQLDWVRNSPSIPRHRPRTISRKEFAKHNLKHDAWLSIDSHVFDVTPYVEYHPGGIDMIMLAAGKVCVYNSTKVSTSPRFTCNSYARSVSNPTYIPRFTYHQLHIHVHLQIYMCHR